jgi:hypothetical protein
MGRLQVNVASLRNSELFNLGGFKLTIECEYFSAEIDYGITFSKDLVDYPDKMNLQAPGKRGAHKRAVMNLMNNEAGRQAVMGLMKNQCRCHGISGSCELKTCWRTLPPFQEIGTRLKDRYENSVAINQLDDSVSVP